MERARRTRLATLGILALVFAAGALTGLASQRSVATPTAETEPRAEEREGRSSRRDDGGRRPAVYEDERLGLSSEQLATADSILGASRERYRTLYAKVEEARDEFERERAALVTGTRGELKALMTPEQAALYDELLAEFDRRRAERKRKRGSEGQGN